MDRVVTTPLIRGGPPDPPDGTVGDVHKLAQGRRDLTQGGAGEVREFSPVPPWGWPPWSELVKHAAGRHRAAVGDPRPAPAIRGSDSKVCASLPRLSDGTLLPDRDGPRGPGSVSTAG